MILSIISLILSISCLIYTGHCSIIFHRFNDSIKDWAKNLDDQMMYSINLAARTILRDLDSKISDINNENNDLNDEKDE